MAPKNNRAKTPTKGAVAIVPDSPSKPKSAKPKSTKSKSTESKSKEPKSTESKSTESGSTESKSKSPPSPRPTRRKTWSGWFFGISMRFYLAYYLYQYLWTCPDDGSDSRAVCRFGDKALDKVEPIAYDAYDEYIDPYYSEYVEPYVEKAAPYAKIANERYLQPATVYACAQFEKHGLPQLEKVKALASAEYTRVLHPHVEKATAQGQVYYDDYLADAVATGQELYTDYWPTVQQFAQEVCAFALEKAHPYYIAALPYLKMAWEQGLETAGWVGVKGKGWVARRWVMNVEPQFWRIQERLGMKPLNMRNATPVKEASPTPPHKTNPNASSSDTAPDTKIDTKETIKDELKEAKEELKDVKEPTADHREDTQDGQPGEEKEKKSPEEIIAAAREEVAADLAAWAAKFEESGIKAAEEVTAKLNKLCEKVLEEQAAPTEEILDFLDQRIERHFQNFEKGVKDFLESPAEHKYVMIGFDNMVASTFSSIESNQAEVKRHTQTFLMDAYSSTADIVDAALASMDSVQDLGMQELGMKWAWLDGVTYKDWEDYHDLKKAFAGIKTKVIQTGQGHKKLRELTEYAQSVDNAAAEIAKAAHNEIRNLERIGRKKLEEHGDRRNREEVAAAEEKEIADKLKVEAAGDLEVDNHGQVVEEASQSEATNLETESEPAERAGTADPEQFKPEESEEVDTSSSPVGEIGEIEIDNKGQVVGEKQSEPDAEQSAPEVTEPEKQTDKEPVPEEPSLNTQKQSQKEDVIVEVENDQPVGEPEALVPPQQERLVEKDEL